MADDRKANPKHAPGNGKEQALKGVKANEALPIERLQNEKNDGRDDREVGQRSSDIVCKACGRGCHRCCCASRGGS
jgi:hypothetical protein